MDDGHRIDKILLNPLGVPVPLDVGCAVLQVDGPGLAVQVQAPPVPELKGEDIGGGADFQHHGVGAGAVYRSPGNQQVVMLLHRNLIDITLGREGAAALLGQIQVVEHFRGLGAGFDA